MGYFKQTANSIFTMIAMGIFFKKRGNVNIPYSLNDSDAVTCKVPWDAFHK